MRQLPLFTQKSWPSPMRTSVTMWCCWKAIFFFPPAAMLANPSGNDFHWVLNWLFTVVTCISIDSAVSWWCKKRALLQNTQKTSRARNPLLCRRRRKHVVQWSILFFLFNIFLQSGSPQKPSQPMPPTSSRLISKPITTEQNISHLVRKQAKSSLSRGWESWAAVENWLQRKKQSKWELEFGRLKGEWVVGTYLEDTGLTPKLIKANF